LHNIAVAVRLILQSMMSSAVQVVISIYRRVREKWIKICKAHISVTADSMKQGIDNFKKHLADLFRLKEKAIKLSRVI